MYENVAPMLRRMCSLLVLLLLSTATSLAADLNGRWEGWINTPDGDVQLVFQFKVDGAVLTGSVETPNGNSEIAQGRVNGDKFSFKTDAGDAEIKHEGTISGDTIQLKIGGPWGDTQMQLKRIAGTNSAKP